MSLPNINAEHLAQLKMFFDMCMENPTLLNLESLSFVKTFIEHFGGKVPKGKPDEPQSKKPAEEPQAEEETSKESEAQVESESEESDLELDMTGVIEPDEDEPQKMGDASIEPTEEQITESQTKRSEAVSAFVEKDYNKAAQLYTEAIMLNPQAALLYAKRGQVFLQLNKPNACIRDCNRALELNPDSAAAHKFRGRAYHLLGKFEEAATDLRLACKFDFDEQADAWLREVTPNAKKIEDHKRKYERKLQEKKENEKRERIKKAKESRKAQEEAAGSQSYPDLKPNSNMQDFIKFMKDNEISKYFQDPEIKNAFAEIAENPTNIWKYQNNPKIMAFINKFSAQLGEFNFMPGFSGFPGNMPNFNSPDQATEENPPKPKPQDDLGLD